MSKEHPFKTGSNTYYMNPFLLKGIGIDVDEVCVVCGEDQKGKDYYVHEGLIHCIPCALKHDHITEKEAEEHGRV